MEFDLHVDPLTMITQMHRTITETLYNNIDEADQPTHMVVRAVVQSSHRGSRFQILPTAKVRTTLHP